MVSHWSQPFRIYLEAQPPNPSINQPLIWSNSIKLLSYIYIYQYIYIYIFIYIYIISLPMGWELLRRIRLYHLSHTKYKCTITSNGVHVTVVKNARPPSSLILWYSSRNFRSELMETASDLGFLFPNSHPFRSNMMASEGFKGAARSACRSYSKTGSLLEKGSYPFLSCSFRQAPASCLSPEYPFTLMLSRGRILAMPQTLHIHIQYLSWSRVPCQWSPLYYY